MLKLNKIYFSNISDSIFYGMNDMCHLIINHKSHGSQETSIQGHFKITLQLNHSPSAHLLSSLSPPQTMLRVMILMIFNKIFRYYAYLDNLKLIYRLD